VRVDELGECVLVTRSRTLDQLVFASRGAGGQAPSL
jgi:hypothetical protein